MVLGFSPRDCSAGNATIVWIGWNELVVGVDAGSLSAEDIFTGYNEIGLDAAIGMRGTTAGSGSHIVGMTNIARLNRAAVACDLRWAAS